MLPADILMSAVLAFLFISMIGPMRNAPGLLFDSGSTAITIWSLLLMIPMAMRRTKPQLAALLFAATVLAQLILGPDMVYADMLAPIMLYSAILYGDRRSSRPFIVLAFAIGALASMVMIWAEGAGSGTAFRPASVYPSCSYGLTGNCAVTLTLSTTMMFSVISMCLIPAIIMAFWQRARRATIRMMQERNNALKAQEIEERRIAALAERARIARDMHDVVAHTLSIIIVQSDGGRYAGANDPTVARHTMETIRHESERALHDMKRLLGVFGGSDHADYRDVDALVAQARSAAGTGCTITKTSTGTPRAQQISPQASTAMYRMVQESLTNVRKYAGPDVAVTVNENWDERGLSVTVTDNGRGASSSMDGHKPGYGLIGMRERIRAAGGDVSSGPMIGGGFRVSAFVPYAAGVTAAASQAASTASSSPASTVSPTEPLPDSFQPATPQTAAQPAQPHPASIQSVPTTCLTPEQPVANHQPASNTPTAGQATISLPAQAETDETGKPNPHRSPARRSMVNPMAHMLQAYSRLKPKPISQVAANAIGRYNWIERLSRWTERHYLLTDLTSMAVLAFLLIRIDNTPMLYLDVFETYGNSDKILTVLLLTPCVFRRRFPEASALATLILATLQLLFAPTVLFADVVAAPLSLYSAVLYGRERAWRWTGIAALAGSLLFGFKALIADYGYETIFQFLFNGPLTPVIPDARSRSTALMFTVVSMLMCAGAMAMARWSRSSGTNALVLQAREEALKEEQKKQRILAANMERDRISANIQTEVTETLTSVIDKAVGGLTMLDECERRGEEPSAQSITDAFAAIGSQGRTALTHMRKLLGVLRETGFSDEAHADAQPGMQLKPAASLDDQLRERMRM